MPASVTGLDYDIDYNYTLSPMDKAYMRIMYPFPGETKELTKALEQVGIAKDNPEKSQMILKIVSESPSDGSLDPEPIRRIFSKWTRDKHAAANKSRDLQPPPEQHRAGRTINARPYDMCSTKTHPEPLEQKKGSSPSEKGASRAVIDPTWLDRLGIGSIVDEEDYIREISWTVVSCPQPMNDPKVLPAQRYQIDRLKEALQDWAKVASVEFIEVKPAEDADIIFTFQKNHSATGQGIAKYDATHRSYCLPTTKIPSVDASSDFSSGMPYIKHTICYRAISDTEDIGELPTHAAFQSGGGNQVTNKQLDLRAIRHEVSDS